MADFMSDTLIGWASMLDCNNTIDDIQVICGNDAKKLENAINAATGRAMSILRSRWPDGWPFNTPPQELRDAVAIMACYIVARSKAWAGGLADALEVLRRESLDQEKYLRDIASGKAHFDIPTPSDGASPASAYISPAPSGEFGFS